VKPTKIGDNHWFSFITRNQIIPCKCSPSKEFQKTILSSLHATKTISSKQVPTLCVATIITLSLHNLRLYIIFECTKMAFSLFLGWTRTNILSAQDLSITYNDKKKQTRSLLHIARLGSLWLDIFISYPMGMIMSTIQMIATLLVLLVILLPFN